MIRKSSFSQYIYFKNSNGYLRGFPFRLQIVGSYRRKKFGRNFYMNQFKVTQTEGAQREGQAAKRRGPVTLQACISRGHQVEQEQSTYRDITGQ